MTDVEPGDELIVPATRINQTVRVVVQQTRQNGDAELIKTEETLNTGKTVEGWYSQDEIGDKIAAGEWERAE